jgi:hypothetical protein
MAFILFDEHLGQTHSVGEVRFAKPRTSVRDLIRARIELELERYKDQTAAALDGRRGSVGLAGDADAAIDGDRRKYGFGAQFLRVDSDRRHQQLEQLVAQAEEGFLRGRYYVLFDDRQAESLDEAIDLDRTAQATFLLLTPLQGG